MMRKTRARTSGLFLLELTLAILFFAIVSAVCVQLFTKSHILTRQSKELAFATNECSSLAELCSQSESMEEFQSLVAKLYSDSAKKTDAVITLSYDKNFSPCNTSDAYYNMAIDCTEDPSMLTVNLRFSDQSDTTIFELESAHHIARSTTYAQR